MFAPDTLVVTNWDLKENPWAEPGVVADCSDSESVAADLIPVYWPENEGRVAWEHAWTLNTVKPGRRAPSPDAADLAADRAGL